MRRCNPDYTGQQSDLAQEFLRMKFVSDRSHDHHSDFITLGTRQPTLDRVVNDAGKEGFDTVWRPF